MSTNAETLVKFNPVVGEIFGEIDLILPSRSKNAFVTLVISGVTELIFIIFARNVANILPLNIIESEWHIASRFQIPLC